MTQLVLSGRDPARWEAVASRATDVVVATAALIVLAIPWVLIVVLIRLTSPGPALFRQERAGKDRRPFTMYKFRTMRPGTDELVARRLVARELAGENTLVDGSCKVSQDLRVTRLGALLRRTSVDEIPQLVNVVRGEMALVGPRPCLIGEAEMFPSGSAPRFTVRPGLTGLWQVSGRSMLGTPAMLDLDVAYVRGRGYRTDLRILARTVPVLLRGDGAR